MVWRSGITCEAQLLASPFGLVSAVPAVFRVLVKHFHVNSKNIQPGRLAASRFAEVMGISHHPSSEREGVSITLNNEKPTR